LLVQSPQPLKGPIVIFFSLTVQKGKSDIEGTANRIDTDHIKKWHPVFIRLIGTVEDKDLGVGSEVLERVGMCEENRCDTAIWPVFNTAPEAFFI